MITADALVRVSEDILLPDLRILIRVGAILEPGVLIKSGALVGEGAELRQGAYLRGDAIIAGGAIVGHVSEVKNSVVFRRRGGRALRLCGGQYPGSARQPGRGDQTGQSPTQVAEAEGRGRSILRHIVCGRIESGHRPAQARGHPGRRREDRMQYCHLARNAGWPPHLDIFDHDGPERFLSGRRHHPSRVERPGNHLEEEVAPPCISTSKV